MKYVCGIGAPTRALRQIALVFGVSVGIAGTGCSLDPGAQHSVRLEFSVEGESDDQTSARIARSASSQFASELPESANGFDCYAIIVTGPEVRTSDYSSVAEANTGACYDLGVTSNLVSVSGGGTMELEIPAGPARSIRLVGVSTTNGCPAGVTLADLVVTRIDTVKAAYEIGAAQKDVFFETSIDLTNSYDPRNPKAALSCLGALKPQLTQVAASSGPSAGGTLVTLTGSAFRSGASVLIGTQPCNGVQRATASSITCATPAGAAGATDVTVENANGLTSTITGAFTYFAPPVLSSVTPTTSLPAGGATITASGTGFRDGVSVLVDTTACSSPLVISATQLICTLPAMLPGTYSMTATNSDGQTSTLADAVTYAYRAPSLSSVTVSGSASAMGALSGGTSILIAGADFLTGATVAIGSSACTGLTLLDSSQIVCSVPSTSTAGAVTVTVTNPDGQEGALASAFTYRNAPPVPSSFTPTSYGISGGGTLILTGSGFDSGASVTIGGRTCTSPSVSSTRITCTIPAGASGTAEVMVTNADGQYAALTTSFQYLSEITISSVAKIGGGALAGPYYTGTQITISGTGFSSSATVTVGGAAATIDSRSGSISMIVTTPSGTPGPAGIVVTNPDGTSETAGELFMYQGMAPSVASVSPSSFAVSGNGGTITLVGMHFTEASGTPMLSAAYVGSTQCAGLEVLSYSEARCTIGGLAEGTYSIRLTTIDDQEATLSNGLSFVGPPTFSSVSPSTASTSGGTSVTITGTNFISPSVTIGGVTCGSVNFSSTSIECTTGSGTGGPAAIVITNSDGQSLATSSTAFTYASSSTPYALVITAADTTPEYGDCVQVTVSVVDSGGNAVNATSDVTVDLATSPLAHGAYYDGSGCANSMSQVLITAGASTATGYYKDTNTTNTLIRDLTADDAGALVDDTQSITLSLPPAPTLFASATLERVSGGTPLVRNGTDYHTVDFGTAGSASADAGITYTCYFDRTIDGSVDTTHPCSELSSSGLTWTSSSGYFDFYPSDTQSTTARGAYEFKVAASNYGGTDSDLFVVDVQDPVLSTSLYAGFDAQFANLTTSAAAPTHTWRNISGLTARDGTLSSSWGIVGNSPGWNGDGTSSSPHRLTFSGAQSVTFNLGDATQNWGTVSAPNTEMLVTGIFKFSDVITASNKTLFSNRGTGLVGITLDQPAAFPNQLLLTMGSSNLPAVYRFNVESLSATAYWRLDEVDTGANSRTFAATLGGNTLSCTRDTITPGNNTCPTYQQASLLSGDYGVLFDGGNDILTGTAGGTFPTGASARSVCFAAKSLAATADFQTVISYGADPAGANQNKMFAISRELSGSGLVVNTGGSGNSVTVTGVFSDVDWHHYCVVYDGSTGISVYMDGAVFGTATLSGLMNTQMGSLSLGGQFPLSGVSGNRGFNGYLDEVSVFSSALSGAQVERLYMAAAYGGCLSSTTLSTTAWYQVAASYDSSSLLSLYINNVQECSIYVQAAYLESPSSDFSVGGLVGGSSSWTGSVGELYIYNEADAASTTIDAHYDSTLGKY